MCQTNIDQTYNDDIALQIKGVYVNIMKQCCTILIDQVTSQSFAIARILGELNESLADFQTCDTETVCFMIAFHWQLPNHSVDHFLADTWNTNYTTVMMQCQLYRNIGHVH